MQKVKSNNNDNEVISKLPKARSAKEYDIMLFDFIEKELSYTKADNHVKHK